ncbi:hypothetical protein FB451DRAFT_1178438 [Mycena latifolia]|nr:hypothetical protein FB451DRAFT_1178438 [Mycena latifolia]
MARTDTLLAKPYIQFRAIECPRGCTEIELMAVVRRGAGQKEGGKCLVKREQMQGCFGGGSSQGGKKIITLSMARPRVERGNHFCLHFREPINEMQRSAGEEQKPVQSQWKMKRDFTQRTGITCTAVRGQELEMAGNTHGREKRTSHSYGSIPSRTEFPTGNLKPVYITQARSARHRADISLLGRIFAMAAIREAGSEGYAEHEFSGDPYDAREAKKDSLLQHIEGTTSLNDLSPHEEREESSKIFTTLMETVITQDAAREWRRHPSACEGKNRMRARVWLEPESSGLSSVCGPSAIAPIVWSYVPSVYIHQCADSRAELEEVRAECDAVYARCSCAAVFWGHWRRADRGGCMQKMLLSNEILAAGTVELSSTRTE